ncbi:ADP-ribosylation/Crystallin J1 [Lasiosphaeris hirsuta]|uniref:ADP-ribosylhydrolase ARH3 n=1 Tax=Lasiosphaeris hirsuta TaxID=260670 RepID=A0AA40EA06_9PEZI|nr:ADP-ribosylation/Crystallin J1 [Lasiosphaeris hirsuta]
MSQPSRRSRTLGALLGVHAGDSLGATVEFQSWAEIQQSHPAGVRDIVGGGPFDWPPGHATDDTDLTRAVLLAYRAAEAARRDPARPKVPDVVVEAARNMVDWYDGRWPGRERGIPPRDVGGATATGIRRFKAGGKGGAGEGRAGNGSLMRCVPTGLFGGEGVVPQAVGISAVTHDDPLCTTACVAYCVMRVGAALEAGRTLVTVRDLAARGPRDAANGPKVLPFKAAGYVLESLVVAVAALFDARPLEEVLVDVVRIGADTDTNAAIAGGLLGARDGVEAIPLRWRERLQFRDEFEDVVDFLVPEEGEAV